MRKVIGKSARNNPEMARGGGEGGGGWGATSICLRALKESKALRLDTNSTSERRRGEGRAKMIEVPAEIKPEMGFGNV